MLTHVLPAVLLHPPQCPDKHQRYMAHVLGIPQHKVVVRTKRLGKPSWAAWCCALGMMDCQLGWQ